MTSSRTENRVAVNMGDRAPAGGRGGELLDPPTPTGQPEVGAEGRDAVYFALLGELEVHDLEGAGNGAPIALGGHRQQLVLAVLLDGVGDRLSTDRLIDAVWGGAPPATAKRTLQAYVSRLRHAIGPDHIETVASGYRLVVEEGNVDALSFRALAAAGEQHVADDPARAATLFGDALSLWRGTPYGSLGDEPALVVSREQLLERRLEVLEHRIACELSTGTPLGVTAELEALVADHPVRERLHGLLMVALYRQGRQSDALEVAARLRTHLADELGLEPSPSIQRVQQQILAHDEGLLAPRDHVAAPVVGRRPPATGAGDGRGRDGWSGDGRGGGRAGPPGPDRHPDDEPPGPPPPNPYRGLHAFREDDARLFFGRRGLVDELLDRIERSPLVVVVGPSGSGKSSAVRAGLLPAVRVAHPTWVVATMVPGAHPFAELEAALVHASAAETTSLAAVLRGDTLDVLRSVLHVLPDEDAHLLLVVDQLEELFLLAGDDERDRFVAALVEAVDDPHSRLTVVATIRADFVERPLRHPMFGGRVEEASVLVPPLTPAELEAACVRPAREVGVAVAPELVAQLVADVASEPGALPSFQYALTELFDSRAGGPLTLAGYHRLGGLEGALARRADELLAVLTPVERDAARQVFLRLVTIGDGTDDTRRRVRRRELEALPVDAGALGQVLERFGAARLLTFDRDAVSGEATVEVAHEAVLREWPALRDWLDAARDDLRLHRALAGAHREWDRAGRDDAYLLTGARLLPYVTWDVAPPVALTSTEAAYLRASIDHEKTSQAAEEARLAGELELEHRATSRLRQLVAVFAVATVIAGGLGVVALDRAGEIAEGEQRALAGTLVREAASAGRDDPELGLLLALHAVRIAAEQGPVGGEVVGGVHAALQRASIPYPDDLPVRVIDSPLGGVRGIYELEVDELVGAARAHVARDLTTSECDRYLDEPTCPSLPDDFGSAITGEQPTAVTPDGALRGTTVRLASSRAWALGENPDVVARLEAVTLATGGVEARLDASQRIDDGPDGPDWAPRDVDIAVFSRPVSIPAFSERHGPLLDISGWVSADAIAPTLRHVATVAADGSWPSTDGSLVGIPVEVATNHLVWYSRSRFAAAGYSPPTTFDGLVALTEEMAADGRTPWCLGLEDSLDGHTEDSMALSGWPAADIVESLVLADLGPAGFDQWASGDIAFRDPRVRTAVHRYADLFLRPGHVAGGTSSAVGTNVWAAMFAPVAANPRGGLDCMMSHGLSVVGESSQGTVDAAWFPFPAIDADGAGTLSGSAMWVVPLTDRPEVRATIAALATNTNTNLATRAGSWGLSPNTDFQVARMPANAAVRELATTYHEALSEGRLVHDASQRMSSEVAAAFSEGMVEVTREGPEAIDRVLAELDELREAAG